MFFLKLDLFQLLFSLQMIFDLTAKKLISYDSASSSENLRESFVAFIKGLISFPLDIPGTAYHKCLQVYIHVDLDDDHGSCRKM